MSLETAKTIFDLQDYAHAIKYLEEARPQINEDQMPEFHDILGASYFLLGQFEIASREYSAAILGNPSMVDYFICMGASLRSMGKYQQAKALLENCKFQVLEPAVNFNLRLIAHEQKENETIMAETNFLEERQHYNEDYSKLKGLVLNFKKHKKDRTDFIYKLEDQVLDLLKISDPEDWREHMHTIIEMVEERVNSCNYLGVLYTQKIGPVIEGLQRLARQIEKSNKSIWMAAQKDQAFQLVTNVFRNISELFRNMGEVTSEKLQQAIKPASDYISKVADKEVACIKNQQQFLTLQKNAKTTGEPIRFNQTGSYQQDFTIISTAQTNYLYISPPFMLKVHPLALTTKLQHCTPEHFHYFYDLYWMLILKALCNSPLGYDLVYFAQVKQLVLYLYVENAGQRLNRDPKEAVNELYRSCAKFNQFYALQALPPQKKTIIQENCSALLKYLDEFDTNLADFITNQKNFSFLTNLQATQNAQVFREALGLQNTLIDLKIQNTILIAYHFRNKIQTHKLLKTALFQIVNETPKNYNGRQSFFIHFEQFINPKSLAKKIWEDLWH